AAARAGRRGSAHRSCWGVFRPGRLSGSARGGRARRRGARRQPRDRTARSAAGARRRLRHYHDRRRGAAPPSPAPAGARLRPSRARPSHCRGHGPGEPCGQSAKIPSLVPRTRARIVRRGRCDSGAGHAMHSAGDRPADIRARRCRASGPCQSRHLHAADLVHRPAGGRRTGAAGAAADCRADYRGAVARGRGAARRLYAGTGRRRGGAQARVSGSTMDIDLPDVVAEVTAAFARYEAALVGNDVETLDALFRDDPRTIRYGATENLYGYAEIKAFRAARSPVGLARTLEKTVITTFGRDLAMASTLFRRTTAPGRIGRQTQTWVRFPDGWRIVAGHVSVIEEPPASS